MDAARHARLGFWAHMAHWLFSPSYRRRDRLVRWAWRRAAPDIADLGHESVVWRFVGEKEKRVHAGLDDGAREYVFHDAYNQACLGYLMVPEFRAQISAGMAPAVRAREAALFADPAYAPGLAKRLVDAIEAFKAGVHPDAGAYAAAFGAMGCPHPVARLEGRGGVPHAAAGR